ncbi:MAG: 6-carboxytetrahydropterin synthase [Bacteroidales bacterium]|nr:6-carboxytetrahydropterin synthase [Bacteroidales bacterium]MDD3890744.1 6-carboxytetrahydropterin synthase [Bacteroidales bacterium]
MAKIRLTKEFTFEMAHVLEGYDGPCQNIHGHSYRLEVTVIGIPIADKANPKCGMVMDFGQLKGIVKREVLDRFDHVLLVCEDSPLFALKDKIPLGKLLSVDFQPTCENLLVYIAKLISAQLPKEVGLHHLKLHETATSYAEWFASDNQ